MAIIDNTQFGRMGYFKYWCQKVLPAVYDDSLSYYELLCKVIHYLNEVIEITNVQSDAITELQEKLKEFMAGHFDAYIEEKVDEWFEENEPGIVAAIEALELQMLQMGMHNHTEPNFRCIDRFIYGATGSNGISYAQAGCVFEQNDTLYWAQLLVSNTANQDRLIIRDLETNTTVGTLVNEFGHGYSLSYNPTTKQILTQDTDSSPKRILLINVANVASPYIQTIITLNDTYVDNPCWFDTTHFIGSIGNNKWQVFDMELNEGDVYDADFGGYSNQHGYTFQNVCWHPSDHTAYFGVTSPDGFMMCDVDDEAKTIKMKDFVECKQYYGYLYMRELEMAYRVGDKMYINQFDTVDGQLVVALLEWDMFNGTIPEENSPYIQYQGNISLVVDYDNGYLIPNSSSPTNTFKLAGDAINMLYSIAGYPRGYLSFRSDYPYIVEGKGADLTIITPADSPCVIEGFHLVNCDIVWYPNATGAISVKPSQDISISGTTYHAGIILVNSTIRISGGSDLPVLYNPNSVSNAIRWYQEYGELNSLHTNKVFTDKDWFRWCVINHVNAASLENANKQRVVVNIAEYL